MDPMLQNAVHIARHRARNPIPTRSMVRPASPRAGARPFSTGAGSCPNISNTFPSQFFNNLLL